MFGIGKGKATTKINPAQLKQLENIWGLGGGLLGGQLGGDYGSQMLGTSQQLYGQGQQMLEGLQSNPFLTGLQQSAQYNPDLVNAQIGDVSNILNRNMQQSIMPQIGRDAVASGGFGGGRQGVAEGLAYQGMQDQLGSAAVGLMGQEQQRAQQAGIAGGGLMAQSYLGGLGALGGLFGLNQGGYQSQWMPLQMQRGLLGNNIMESKDTSKKLSFG